MNGNMYVGSSINLDKRFIAHLASIPSIDLPLYRSILKYGLNNFAFLLLQFCDKDEDICLGLEQHYLDFYHPEYNILKLAGSSKGFKHSPDTIAKLKKLHSGKLHPR
jgi:group I intron endonuclease